MIKMSTIEYRIMQDSDIEAVLSFWKNIDGVHLHSKGKWDGSTKIEFVS